MLSHLRLCNNQFFFYPTISGFCTVASESTRQSKGILDYVFKKNKFSTLDDWYNVTRTEIVSYGGNSIFKKGETVYDILCKNYPDHKWEKHKFKRHPKNYWNNDENQKQFLENLSLKFNIKQPKDWCNIKSKDIQINGGKIILSKFSNLQNILKYHYPQYPWDEWFTENNSVIQIDSKKSKEFWSSITNQRKFMDKLFIELNLKTLDDWTQVNRTQIIKYGGMGLFNEYNNLFEALKQIYPNHDWNIFQMKIIPNNFWNDKKNHRFLLDNIAKKLNLTSVQEFSSISKKDILHHGGKSLFSFYPNLFEALKENYKEIQWNIFDFKPIPKHYWADKTIQRQFLDEFARKHNIQSQQDWRNVNGRDIHIGGGSSILKQYSSVFEMFSCLYPEYSWDIFLDRNSMSRNFWNDNENRKKFLLKVKEKYKIENEMDWKRISKINIIELGGAGLLQKFGSIENILIATFPDIDWHNMKLDSKKKRSSQRKLFLLMLDLFPEIEVIEDFVHEELTRKSGFYIEFDIFIPKYQIAIEYHGEHHYSDIPSFGPFELYAQRDMEKLSICSKNNIHLVVIPYFLHNNLDDIILELKKQLPTKFHNLIPDK